jgi:DNA-binding GntR family transcriptional regulator
MTAMPTLPVTPVPVDRESPDPPWMQVRSDLERRIGSGEYRPGQRLPSIPQLMERYGVARVTIVKAVRALSAEGLVETRPGWGTFVRRA